MNQVVTATPATTVSPKVKASAWTTLALSLLGAVVAGVMGWADTLTPSDLPDLGLWALPAITLLTGVLNTLSAYLKRDPLREEVVQAVLAPVPVGRPTVVDVAPNIQFPAPVPVVDEFGVVPDKLTVAKFAPALDELNKRPLDDEVVDNLLTRRPPGGVYASNVELTPEAVKAIQDYKGDPENLEADPKSDTL